MAGLRNSIVTCLVLHGVSLAERDAGTATLAMRRIRRWLYKDARVPLDLEQRLCIMGQQALRVVPLDSAANRQFPLGLLFHEILDLVHAQANLLYNDLYFSGVMTCGLVLDSPEVFVGAGVARAQNLLGPCARLPRVVVDPELLALLDIEPLLRKDTHDPDTEKRYVKGLLRRDSDGLWFIDYLWAMNQEADDLAQYAEFLKHHHDFLQARLRTRKRLDERAVQLGWLGRYHNLTIHRLCKKYPSVEAFSNGDLLLSSLGPTNFAF